MPPIRNAPNKAKNSKKTIITLIKFLKYYSLPIIFGLLCAGVSTVLAILGPNEIYKIGTLLYNKPVELSEVTKLAIGLIIIYVSSFLFSFIQNFLMSGVQKNIANIYMKGNKMWKKLKDLKSVLSLKR